MKKIFLFALAALALGFTACVEDEVYKGISDVSITPGSPTPDNDVTVTATATGIDALTLKYKAGNEAEKSLPMAGTKGTAAIFKAVIPAQADGTIVKYYVEGGGEKSAVKEYTVSAEVIEVVINEVNGSGEDEEKYIELYNKGAAEVSLAGFKIDYNGKTTWTGTATHKIAGGGYLVLKGSKGKGDMSTGLSSGSAITVDLYDAKGNQLDKLEKKTATDGQLSMERIPNGTGDFYYTTQTGTSGKTNSTDKSGGKVE